MSTATARPSGQSVDTFLVLVLTALGVFLAFMTIVVTLGIAHYNATNPQSVQPVGPVEVTTGDKPLAVIMVEEPPKLEPIVDPYVKPAGWHPDADLPPTLPDLATGPLKIVGYNRFCIGRPSTHSTITLFLENTSEEKVINVTRGVFNPEEIYYASRPFPLQPDNCPASDPTANGLKVYFDHARAKVGKPIAFAPSISVPPGKHRSISIRLEFWNVPPSYQPYLNLTGTFTLFYDGGEASSETIVVAGEPDINLYQSIK